MPEHSNGHPVRAIPKRRTAARNYMGLALSDDLNRQFTSLLRSYGAAEVLACLERREAAGRTWWMIGDVVAWAVDTELRQLPSFRAASSQQRERILDILSFLETVVQLSGAYDGFNTMPFPSMLHWANLGECILEQDLCSVRGAQLYGPRVQRLLVLADHPSTEARQLLGCSGLFFEKVCSREPGCQYVVLLDQGVLTKELTGQQGTPGLDFSSPSVELLSQRVLAAQCGVHFQYFKDRSYSYDTGPDPNDNLASLNVALQTVFSAHEEHPESPLNVLVVVGADPTRTQAIVNVFKSKLAALAPSEAPVAFTFLQTGNPAEAPGLFECCRDDGQFCSSLLQELADVSPRVVEVLRPSVLAGASLSEFLGTQLPLEGTPCDPIGDYRQVRRGLCVPSAPARPCAPCRGSRLCGAPKSCSLQ